LLISQGHFAKFLKSGDNSSNDPLLWVQIWKETWKHWVYSFPFSEEKLEAHGWTVTCSKSYNSWWLTIRETLILGDAVGLPSFPFKGRFTMYLHLLNIVCYIITGLSLP
jgi:hypothetical protein